MSTTLWNGSNQISGSSESDLATIKSNLTSNETSFKFGVDSEGNYGYYKSGETAVTPFAVGNTVSNNFDYQISLCIRSCHPLTNYFLVDVSNIDTIYYFQSHQGGAATTFYGYTSYDWDDPEGTAGETTLVTISNSKTDTSMYWIHSIDVSSYQVVKFAEGYNWGGTLLATDNGKYFEKVRIVSGGGWSEMNILVPSNKRALCTALDTTNTIVTEQRINYRLNEGYGQKNTGHALTSLSTAGQAAIYPSTFAQGRWIWIGGQTASASGTYSADVELIEFDETNLTSKFIGKTCSIENTSYRTLSIDNNMALIFHRTQTTASCATWWSEIPIVRGSYTKLVVEVTLDQQGDGSSEYNNFVGFSDHYPGETYLGVDGGGVHPITNYDTDYEKYITLGNSTFAKKTITLDISDFSDQRDMYLKITAGTAGFIVHSIRLT